MSFCCEFAKNGFCETFLLHFMLTLQKKQAMENVYRMNLPVADSTNLFVREMLEEQRSGQVVSPGVLPGFTLVVADYQTAGRGQQGSFWESERGKNLTFSLLCHPDFVKPSHQFLLSQCMAISVREALLRYVESVEVKWPNDIYVNDKKISGTLIECDLQGGRITNCIIGVGVNVNQEQFKSDAPNPVSLSQLIGVQMNREEVLSAIISRFGNYYELLRDGKADEVRQMYMNSLYRREGRHRYADVRGEFMAEIADVEPTGHLLLRFDDGRVGRYEFKEVRFVSDAQVI